MRTFPPAKGNRLNFFGIAFAAGAIRTTARASYLDVSESAVAARMVILAAGNVASYILINVFHIKPSESYFARKIIKYSLPLTKSLKRFKMEMK